MPRGSRSPKTLRPRLGDLKRVVCVDGAEGPGLRPSTQAQRSPAVLVSAVLARFIRSHTGGGVRSCPHPVLPAASRPGVTPALPGATTPGAQQVQPMPLHVRPLSQLQDDSQPLSDRPPGDPQVPRGSGARRGTLHPSCPDSLPWHSAQPPAHTAGPANPSRPMTSPQDPRQDGLILSPNTPEALPLSVQSCLYPRPKWTPCWVFMAAWSQKATT